MQVQLHKLKSDSKGADRVCLKAKRINNLNFSKGLMLVLENKFTDKDHGEFCTYELKKVEFLCAVKIDGIDGEFIAAQYITMAELYTIILSELPMPYFNAEYRPILFNYRSYKDVCELTGEQVMDFKEYLQSVVLNENNAVNSLDLIKGSLLNYDQQKEHRKKFE